MFAQKWYNLGIKHASFDTIIWRETLLAWGLFFLFMKYENCVGCGKSKEEVIYGRIYQTNGLCMGCKKKEYYYSHQKQISLAGKKYYEKNKAKIKIKAKKYRKENWDKILEYQKLNRSTPDGYSKLKARVERYKSKNPDRVKAWRATTYYKITHEPCVVCGKEKTHRHHPDPKQKLLIIHLCPQHHKWVHMGKIVL